MQLDNTMTFGRRIRRVVRLLTTLLLCFALVGVTASTAVALDKNQLVQMSKLGLDAKAIKGAIDSSGDELMLSQEELGELRAQGVSDEVIEYLKETGHVEGASAAAPADQPAPGGPAPAPGAGPAPAPAPGQMTEEQKQAEQQRLQEQREREIEEKARQLNQQKQQAEQRERQIAQAARRLPGAADDVDAGDYMDAARTYLEFLALGPAEGSEHWYEAKFGLAKALYKKGILSGAATPLLEVIMAGAERPHFKEAFYMLEALTERIGYRPPVLEEMTKFYVGDFNADFKNDFNYYLGKFFFDYGKDDLAIQYLGQVAKGAEDYPEALYLLGAAKVDPQGKQMGEALRHFEDAIVSAEAEPGGNQEILQLGYLALARVFYEAGLYDVALYYYQKIPRQSARNAPATFETAWTYFLKNDYKRALGTFHTLHSPYFAEWYFPDLYILESTVYLNLCKFDRSKEALAEFQQKYLDKRPRLASFMQNTQDPSVYWQAATDGLAADAEHKLPAVFRSAVLKDLSFYNIYKVIQTLENERQALQTNVGSLGDFGQQVLDRVEQQLDTKIQEGGILVQQELQSIDQELQDWDLKATQISFDIDSEEKQQLQRRLRNQGVPQAAADTGTTLLIVADDFTPWPFEGEYWFDEVNNYRSRLRSECVEQ